MHSTSVPQKTYRDYLSFWYLALIPLSLCLLVEISPLSDVPTSQPNNVHTNKVNNTIQNDTRTPKIPIKKDKFISSHVGYSFYGTALGLGIAPNTIQDLTSLSAGKFDFINSVSGSGQFAFKLDENDQLVAFLYRDKSHAYYVYSTKTGSLFSTDGKRFYKDKLLLSPVSRQFRISSQFSHSRLHPVTRTMAPHLGTDYAVPVGTPVVSISSGEVIASRYHPIAGNYLVIQHPGGLKTRYLHLSKRYVRKGDIVLQGETVGVSGNTGRTTGAHLHFELWKNGRPIDFEKKRAFAEKVAVQLVSSQFQDAQNAYLQLSQQLN
ncbi:M23 family metallopeptidase [Vibrio neptunius]|uniref:Peptidoglycan DD-metalloendopeptidase family protein n=1 Tax=Vibrio neptunius TaxID=170651 RepID=A0ABS2ZZJ4_9VIBR|nr:peptidoglycan DD-metalloendopeptidase family protein [Vibrio neptunius]MBN3492389.1 peptidoglycan DD-metalloendopeptidase family protein [Vibrio neptunius]MBN3514796.1 peptidoglycan DD-metalloendopeptidase family protein [Vibrio neptunius]MBN3551536.1 peptidoglycan DD-metalloendopeptidase family protein [Vibrio neptunius]MBN3577014.1 peptidoglycan DD-metalloendopeptidase family protein [Vibrio neptunius]MCH9870678.1 peptidoglycan DD-metalloendopeptidase family protein [Vibrio neptunius]